MIPVGFEGWVEGGTVEVYQPGTGHDGAARRVDKPGRAEALPLALADLHRTLAVGAPAELALVPGRSSAWWTPEALARVAEGAGFSVVESVVDEPRLRLLLRRERSLADTVGPDMRVLVCGLNPSLYAADAGVGFARPGNRFWPAMTAAGLASRDRDAVHLLTQHGIGMTDLVKRATARAEELTPAEYRRGFERLDWLVGWLRPRVVCFVGLAGWRAAVDRRATAGVQDRRLGGAAVYLMPSTSGLNAHSRLDDLTAHLRAAWSISA